MARAIQDRRTDRQCKRISRSTSAEAKVGHHFQDFAITVAVSNLPSS